MKKALTMILFMIIIYSLAGTTEAANSEVKILFNSTPMVFSEKKPFIENGRTMIPISSLRDVLTCKFQSREDASIGVYISALGFDIEKKTAIRYGAINLVEGETNMYFCTMNSESMYLFGGETVEMDIYPVVKDGELFIPLRYVMEYLGYIVEWDAAEYCINIYKNTLDLDALNIQYYDSSAARKDITMYPVITKITSVEELAAYHEKNRKSFDGISDGKGNRIDHKMETEIFFNAEKFNESFFNKNFLLFILLEEASSTVKHEVTDVKVSENVLDVAIKHTISGKVLFQSIAYHHIVLEFERGYLDKEIYYNGAKIVAENKKKWRLVYPSSDKFNIN